MEDNFSTDGGGVGDGSGGNASDGERQMKLRSLTLPPLTSCCAACTTTRLWPRGGDPWSKARRIK